MIGGTLKGKKLAGIRGRAIRPTADRLRESIFNIIAPRVADAVVLDLFAGTGAFGIEALSRRARAAVFVDNSRAAVNLIHRNLQMCRLQDRAQVVCRDVTRGLAAMALRQPPFDLVFMDPPYNQGLVHVGVTLLRRSPLVSPAHRLILEHATDEPLAADPDGYRLYDQRRYGKTLVSFLESVV